MAETIEPSNHQNFALNSKRSTIQSAVSQVYHGKMLLFGLSRFCSSFNILWQKTKNFATVQVMFKFLQTYTWPSLLWNFSMSWPNKFWAKSPLAEWLLKFHWTPVLTWGFLFIPFLWQLHVAINSQLHQISWRKADAKAHAEKG